MERRTLKFLGATLILLSLASFFGCQAIQRKVLFFPSNHANANGFTRWENDGAMIGYAREAAERENVWLMPRSTTAGQIGAGSRSAILESDSVRSISRRRA